MTFPGESVEGGGASQDVTLYLQAHEWAIVWAHMHIAPNALNDGIRRKIEAYFEASGVPLAELQAVAEQARAVAGAFMAGSVQNLHDNPVDPGEGNAA